LEERKRRLSIAAAGLAAVALAWFAPPGREPELSLPADRLSSLPGAAKGESSPSPSSRLAALPAREALGAARGDPFGAPVVPAHRPAAAKHEPPPAPVAPPNPYKVAGTVVQGGAKRVYLLNGDRVYEARQGDDLDGGYKVELIGGDHVVLVYVPMGTREELPIATTLGADVPVASSAVASPTGDKAAQAGPAAATADPARPAELRWEGPQKVRAGASFTVVLKVTSFQGLRATPMQLTYEPKLLEAVNVRAGKFFGAGNFSYRVNPDGAIFVGATGEGAAPGADAELLAVTFKPIKAGNAEVKLSSLALQGPAGRALAHNQIDSFRTAIE